MRTAPLTLHDRSTIIAQLARSGEWEGARSGYPIRILRFRAAGRQRIEYSVRVRFAWISAAAETVAAALDDINKIIVEGIARRASKVVRIDSVTDPTVTLNFEPMGLCQ